MNDVVAVAPVQRFAQLENVPASFLERNTVRHLFQQLQHILQHNSTPTLFSMQQ